MFADGPIVQWKNARMACVRPRVQIPLGPYIAEVLREVGERKHIIGIDCGGKKNHLYQH